MDNDELMTKHHLSQGDKKASVKTTSMKATNIKIRKYLRERKTVTNLI